MTSNGPTPCSTRVDFDVLTLVAAAHDAPLLIEARST
jgi:hypothetical protein